MPFIYKPANPEPMLHPSLGSASHSAHSPSHYSSAFNHVGPGTRQRAAATWNPLKWSRIASPKPAYSALSIPFQRNHQGMLSPCLLPVPCSLCLLTELVASPDGPWVIWHTSTSWTLWEKTKQNKTISWSVGPTNRVIVKSKSKNSEYRTALLLKRTDIASHFWAWSDFLAISNSRANNVALSRCLSGFLLCINNQAARTLLPIDICSCLQQQLMLHLARSNMIKVLPEHSMISTFFKVLT